MNVTQKLLRISPIEEPEAVMPQENVNLVRRIKKDLAFLFWEDWEKNPTTVDIIYNLVMHIYYNIPMYDEKTLSRIYFHM